MVQQNKNNYFMKIAELTSENSTCIRLKVGAILCTLDNIILSTGYNGTPPGIIHCNKNNLAKITPCNCIHAEQNAIIKCNESWKIEKKIYITTFPCFMCAKLLVNFNVKELFFKKNYREMQKSIDFLKLCNIKYRQING